MFVKQAFDLLWRSFRAEGNNWDPGALNCFDKLPTLRFQGWRISALPKSGSSRRCGAAPCSGTGSPEGTWDFGARGSPQSPALSHTQGRDTPEHPPGPRQCAEIWALPAEEEADLPQGLPVPALQGHQDLPRECLPSFSTVFSGEIMF